MDLHTVLLLPSILTLLATSTILITLPCIYLLRIDAKNDSQCNNSEENIEYQSEIICSSSDNSCEEYSTASSEVESEQEQSSEDDGDEKDYLSYEEALCEITGLLSQLGVYTYFTTEQVAPNENWIKMENEDSLTLLMKMVKSKNA